MKILTVINRLTLLSLFGLDELGPHVGPYDVGAPQVAHPEHQTQLVVSQRDDGVFGEHQRLCSFVGLRDLHKHTADLEKRYRRGEADSNICSDCKSRGLYLVFP